MSWIVAWDWNILNFIQTHLRSGFADALMVFLTRLGDGGFIWILTGILLMFFKRYRATGATLLVGLVIGAFVGSVFIKNIVERARPSWFDTSVSLLIRNPADFSFPSGHSLTSFAAATVLSCSNRRFAAPAIILACLIALSRLYLFVHFPTDVLVGSLSGVIIGLLTYRFLSTPIRRVLGRYAA